MSDGGPDCGDRSQGYWLAMRNSERKAARVGGTLVAVMAAFLLVVVVGILLLFVL